MPIREICLFSSRIPALLGKALRGGAGTSPAGGRYPRSFGSGGGNCASPEGASSRGRGSSVLPGQGERMQGAAPGEAPRGGAAGAVPSWWGWLRRGAGEGAEAAGHPVGAAAGQHRSSAPRTAQRHNANPASPGWELPTAAARERASCTACSNLVKQASLALSEDVKPNFLFFFSKEIHGCYTSEEAGHLQVSFGERKTYTVFVKILNVKNPVYLKEMLHFLSQIVQCMWRIK